MVEIVFILFYFFYRQVVEIVDQFSFVGFSLLGLYDLKAVQPRPFIEFGWKVVHLDLVVLHNWLQTSF